jgi:hypothetical protein
MLLPQVKLIHVHIPKSAGGSLMHFFARPVNNKNVVGDHENLAQMQEHWPYCENWISFVVVRNIWHRLVSHYNQYLSHPLWKVRREYPSGLTFPKFVRVFVNDDLLRDMHNITFMTKGANGKKVDFILRYEHLIEDLEQMLKSTNLSHLDVKDLSYNRHGNQEYKRNYKSYYDDETRKLVEQVYADDIKTFGFRFEDL